MLEETSESLIGLEPMSARQIVVRYRTPNKRSTLIVTNVADEVEREEFYDRFRTALYKRTR